MDYFKATERYLYNYRSIQASIVNMTQQIEEIISDFVGAPAINPEHEPTGKTYKFNSAVENEVIRRDEEVSELRRKIDEAKRLVVKIDRSIASLPALEQRIVRLKYFSGEDLSWFQIANIVQYSVDHCKGKARRRAVKRIAIAIFGLEAMNNFSPLPLFSYTG